MNPEDILMAITGALLFCGLCALFAFAGLLTRGQQATNDERIDDERRAAMAIDSQRHELDYMRQDGTL